MKASSSAHPVVLEPKQNNHLQELYDYTFEHGPMAHLPPLISPESAINAPFFMSPAGSSQLNCMQEVECSQNLLRLTAAGCGLMQQERFNGDWSLLDKFLITSNQSLIDQSKSNPSPDDHLVTHGVGTSTQKFPFQYIGRQTDILKYSKY